MSLTPSKMVPLGSIAPDFSLPDVISGKKISLDEVYGEKGLLVMFICNHCPYVKHIKKELIEICNEYLTKGIGIAAISSNDIDAYPEDSPEAMRNDAKEWQYHFPYFFDESQDVAKAYQAACTPDFYLYNAYKALVYRGQFDSSRPGNNIPVTGEALTQAMNDLVAGNPISDKQISSMGCSIKWIN